MARDNSNPPAYSEVGTPADATGERTAENTDQGTVTEAQAAEAQDAPQDAEKAQKDETTDTAEAARKQAEEDAQARLENPNGLLTREANPNVGGEGFHSFTPAKD